MANRSYLFSIDFDRTKEKRDDTKKVCGLSEYNYGIPLSYLILASQDAEISNSIIWNYEYPIAIIADFYKGRKKLFDFLDNLLSKNIFEQSQLENKISTTKDFLLDKKHENKYIILECGEIFEMEEGEPEDHNKNLFETVILGIEEAIEKYLNHFPKERDKAELWSMLGIDNWDDVLYYSF